jgi:anti-sigma factor RsiW
MDCNEAREHLLDYQRGRLTPEVRERVAAHVESCEACRRVLAEEAAMSELLDRRMPQHVAPLALKRRLADLVPPEHAADVAPPRERRWTSRFAPPLASAVAAALITFVIMHVRRPEQAPSEAPGLAMINEGVNDHLRVVYSTHPVEIESGGIHQVKPWFTGRLDFAPRVAFSGDDEFPLVGGSIGYFRDRKAAVFVFKHKLHTISLFVFRSAGFDWPMAHPAPIGRFTADVETVRGFSVVSWHDEDLGYCLVSDVDREELARLASKIAGDG